jgi:hypothetical protein
MMKAMDPNKKYMTYFEYMAAHLYYSDLKLHLILDQADSGLYLEDGEWDSGMKNPTKGLNFNKLWDALNAEKKEFYLKLTRHNFYNTSEIRSR